MLHFNIPSVSNTEFNSSINLTGICNEDLNEITYLQPEGWPDIIREFDFYIKSGFCNPIKAKINNRIVGVGASITYKDTSWIAHIIVDQNFRKHGIGTMIVQKLLEELNKHNIDTCLLIATELGKSVYERLGFRTVSDYLFFKKEKDCIGIPKFRNFEPYREEYFPPIIALDRRASGEEREGLFKNKLGGTIVYIENGVLLGFYSPEIGEGLVIADTADAGTELMKIKYSTADKAVIPAENMAGVEFLKANGFIESATKGTRMILGKNISWIPEKIFSRIGGNFG